MPEEDASQRISQEPERESNFQAPGKPPGNQNPPTPPATGDADHHDEESRQLQQEIRSGERMLIGIGIATILVNLGIWYTYSGQLDQMRIATEAGTRAANLASDSLDSNTSQFDRAMKQTIRQTVIQYEATQAAIKSADTAKDALLSVQRAFVGFPANPEMSIFNLKKGTVVTLRMPIENAGVTLARAVKDRVSCVTPLGSLPGSYTFPDIDGGLELKCGVPWAGTGASTIPAKSNIFTQSVLVDPKMLDEFMQQNVGSDASSWRAGPQEHPTRQIVLYGWVTYRDIFKGTPEHLTEFCRSLISLIAGTPEQPAWKQQWTYCPMQNCTDEDCPDYKMRIKKSDASPIWPHEGR